MKMLTDNPTNKDKYGFSNYAEFLTEAILDTDDLPFLMGIYGAWGSGKSSLMMMIQDRLMAAEIKCIWFNPWKYDNKEDLWSALIQTILFKIADENQDEQIKKDLKKLAGNVAWSFLKTGVSALTHGVIDGEKLDGVKEAFTKDREERYQYLNTFEENFKIAIADYTNNTKLVVFVDDIDRCAPENSITVLESLKLFIGNASCVFVLGMDHRIVEQGIQYKYGGQITISGREYLDKIIQVPFFVPPVPFDLLRNQLESFSKTTNYVSPVWELIQISFKSNPRKTKRFINSFHFVIEMITNSDLVNSVYNLPSTTYSQDGAELSEGLQQFILAYVLVVQMNFPDYYNFILRTGDIYSLVDLDEMYIDGAGTGNDIKEFERAKKELLNRYQDLDILFENIELGLFIRDTKQLILDFDSKPSKEEIKLITQFINLLSRPSSVTSTTTTRAPRSSYPPPPPSRPTVSNPGRRPPKPHMPPSK